MFLEYLALPSSRVQYNFGLPSGPREAELSPRLEDQWMDDYTESYDYDTFAAIRNVPGVNSLIRVTYDAIAAAVTAGSATEQILSELEERIASILAEQSN